MIKIKEKNNFIGALILFALMFTACSENALFDEYQSLPNNVFDSENPVSFTFQIQDAIHPKSAFIQLRNNSDYQYSNLYLITNLKYPSGKQEVDTLQYMMADPMGRFLGSGLSTIKENVLCYQNNCKPKRFEESGQYTFTIKQAMRKIGAIEGIDLLEGITDIGFKIKK